MPLLVVEFIPLRFNKVSTLEAVPVDRVLYVVSCARATLYRTGATSMDVGIGKSAQLRDILINSQRTFITKVIESFALAKA